MSFLFYDKGTPINNSLEDLKSLIMLLARKKEFGQRAGFLKYLKLFSKWKKELPKRDDLKFEFILARKKEEADVKKELGELPGQQ